MKFGNGRVLKRGTKTISSLVGSHPADIISTIVAQNPISHPHPNDRDKERPLCKTEAKGGVPSTTNDEALALFWKNAERDCYKLGNYCEYSTLVPNLIADFLEFLRFWSRNMSWLVDSCVGIGQPSQFHEVHPNLVSIRSNQSGLSKIPFTSSYQRAIGRNRSSTEPPGTGTPQ